jgi:molybdopterin/thiamine biosynthesis adenylyltransferase
MPTDTGAVTLAQHIQRLRPQYAQQFVLLWIGLGTDRDQWQGWVFERDQYRPLSGFQITGASGLHVTRRDESYQEFLANPRHLRLRNVFQESGPAIADANIGIVGCSRSGSIAAWMFASLGVRRIGLVDGDDIEAHNLDSMAQVTADEIGRNKALVVGRSLTAYRPELTVVASPRPFGASHDEPALAGVDLLVTCVDDDTPRLRGALLAADHQIPHLDIATGVTRDPQGELTLAADVQLLFPGEGCVRCVGKLVNLSEAERAVYSVDDEGEPRRRTAWDAHGRIGSLSPLNSAAVSTGILSWLDRCGGKLGGSIWHRLLWRQGASWQDDTRLVTAAPDCPICRRDHSAVL